MIARVWQGWAAAERAEAYERHYAAEVAEHLRQVDGFLGAKLLRREVDGEVQFTSIVFFADLDAVRAFAGPGYDHAVLEETARRVLTRWDDRVSHHDVAADLPR